MRQLFGSGLMDLLDHIGRAAAHFLVDARHILAHDPNARDADALEEEQNSNEGEDSLDLGADDQAANREQKNESPGEGGHDQAHQAEGLERRRGKARHEIEVESYKAIQIVL